MRILVGITEVAGIAANYTKGFRALGHEAATVIARRDPYFTDEIYDFDFDTVPPPRGIRKLPAAVSRRARTAYAFPRMMNQFDIFLFLWGGSFLPWNIDFPILKRAGKTIISVFLGSDIRHSHAFLREMESLGAADEVRPFLIYLMNSRYRSKYSSKKRIVHMAERYADLILSQPGYAQLQTRPYMRFNIPLDLSQYQYHYPDREAPLIIHAPSNRGIKGTEIVFDVINRLKQEGLKFEFRLIENMQNREIRDLLSEADIVVDELYAETVAVLSSEAMASGAVTLVRYMAEYAKVPLGCPAVNVTKETLLPKLREVIVDRGLRRRIAEAGPVYVKANNDHVRVARDILQWVEQGVKKFDFYPEFHRQYAAEGRHE